MPDGPWLPGSFTKNFSWGEGRGLRHLYDSIRTGFDGELKPVPRDEYRHRIVSANRPDFIPINYFLFNEIRDGVSYIIVDELVFQALTTEHSPRFDKLALFALNFSHAGIWRGARAGQRYPTLWARQYIVDVVAKKLNWNTSRMSATDVQEFLLDSPQFVASSDETYRKVATNLNFIYDVGDLGGFRAPRIERWWVDALFLALDRIIADRRLDGLDVNPSEWPARLSEAKFREITGPVTLEKTFAIGHLLSLYAICGGESRFDPEKVSERVSVLLPDYDWRSPNDTRPQGAVHPTNPRILKTIPRACAPLAEQVGFEIVYADDLESFDPEEYVRRRTADAIEGLQRDGVRPTMTADELYKLTRGE